MPRPAWPAALPMAPSLGGEDLSHPHSSQKRAAALLGSGVALLDAIGAAFKPFERHLHDDAADRAQALIGAEAYQHERMRGAALPLEEAIAEALEVARGSEKG